MCYIYPPYQLQLGHYPLVPGRHYRPLPYPPVPHRQLEVRQDQSHSEPEVCPGNDDCPPQHIDLPRFATGGAMGRISNFHAPVHDWGCRPKCVPEEGDRAISKKAD